ncbi:hypothetical protein TB2_012965 [Malus domestica]
MMEVVKKEIVKLLDCGVVYPISDSRWVSLVQVVPKKSGVIVVKNEENELVPTVSKPVGEFALIVERSTPPQGRITSLCHSLIKCLKG